MIKEQEGSIFRFTRINPSILRLTDWIWEPFLRMGRSAREMPLCTCRGLAVVGISYRSIIEL